MIISPADDAHIRELLGVPNSKGFVSWCEVSPLTLRTLAAERFLDLADTQNGSPEFGTMISCAEKIPGAWLHGYYNGQDIGIEGAGVSRKMTLEEVYEFVAYFRDADEFDLDDEGAWAWYD